MKSFVCAVLAGVSFCPSAYALHPASAMEVRRVAAFLREARWDQSAADTYSEQMSKIRDPQAAAELRRKIARKKDEVKVARDKAIHLALTAYGIVPAGADERPEMPDGVVQM